MRILSRSLSKANPGESADHSREKTGLFSEEGFPKRLVWGTGIAIAAIFAGIGYGHTQDAFGPPKWPVELPEADPALDRQSVLVQPKGDGDTTALNSLD